MKREVWDYLLIGLLFIAMILGLTAIHYMNVADAYRTDVFELEAVHIDQNDRLTDLEIRVKRLEAQH